MITASGQRGPRQTWPDLGHMGDAPGGSWDDHRRSPPGSPSGRAPISAAREAFSLCNGTYGERYRKSVGMHGPDEDDVVEHGGAPLRLPGWARRPRWLPALGWRPSRGAAILGIAGLIAGLAAGYAPGCRPMGRAVRPSRATAAGAVPSAAAGSAAPSDPAASAGGPGAYSSGLRNAGVSGLVQTGGACSVQRGRDLQVGVEVIDLSGTNSHRQNPIRFSHHVTPSSNGSTDKPATTLTAPFSRLPVLFSRRANCRAFPLLQAHANTSSTLTPSARHARNAARPR